MMDASSHIKVMLLYFEDAFEVFVVSANVVSRPPLAAMRRRDELSVSCVQCIEFGDVPNDRIAAGRELHHLSAIRAVLERTSSLSRSGLIHPCSISFE